MVRVGVGGAGVVHIEQTVVAVLAIVAANIDHRVRRVEVPVIAGGPDAKTSAPHRQSRLAAGEPGGQDFTFSYSNSLAKGGGFGPLPLHSFPR